MKNKLLVDNRNNKDYIFQMSTIKSLANRKNKKITCLDVFTGKKEIAKIVEIKIDKIVLKFPDCKYININEFSDVEYTGKQLKFN